jgi:adenine-specific DNA-methyltransferase
MTKEEKFYNALKDIFVGAKVEGESGYINLMRIKSRYYEKGVFPKLQNDIEEALKPFPEFKEELFDKLYTFFHRYFSESGSIYFRYTPIHQNVYEKIYTDDKDVILFWKTHMLYYVKTDRLFKNLEVEIDGFKFFFDVSTLEHKKAFEKREIIYEFKEIKDGTIVFNVFYSERNRTTKTEEILKALNKGGIKITEDVLEKAFRVFEKQSEVDYFINKNAKEFLREQFNIWLYQYVFSGESEWTEKRIKQLQVLKDIAFKIIDFISQFEDELVKIWNKPKFVLNSNYVITLDRIVNANRENGFEIIEKIINHPNFDDQIKEWKELGIIDNIDKKRIIENTLNGKELNKKYQFLPIDTKYFKDLELEILGLFDDLDNSLDGWLIKSENYQALNTILPKFRERVQTIYIDPPFNKEQDADYFYSVKYKDSSWITLLENRLQLARDILKDTGSIFVRCDYNGNMYVRLLMNEIFGEENFRNEITINRKRQAIGTPDKFEVESEHLFLFSKTERYVRQDLYKPRSLINIKWTGFLKQEERRPPERIFFGKVLYPPKGQHFSLNQEKVDKLLRERYLRLKCKECSAIYYYDENESKENFVNEIVNSKDKFKYMDITNESKVFGVKFLDKCLSCGSDNWKVEYLTSEEEKITDNWKDIPSYEDTFGFKTQNSEILLKRVIESTSNEGDLVMDFFLGSGTTTAVAHKLKRKWIGVEMGEHFWTVVLPRMKKVLFYDKSGISKEKDVKEKYNEKMLVDFSNTTNLNNTKIH